MFTHTRFNGCVLDECIYITFKEQAEAKVLPLFSEEKINWILVRQRTNMNRTERTCMCLAMQER